MSSPSDDQTISGAGEEDLKISDLSRRSGVPLATVKYYLRERLLPPGTRTASNQATYGPPHLERLAAIRAMREIAGLPIAVIRRVVGLIDDDRLPFDRLVAQVTDLIVPSETFGMREETLPLAEVGALLEAAGLPIRPDSAVRRELATTLAALRAHYLADVPAEALVPYAEAIREIARTEIGYFLSEGVRESRDRAVSRAIMGTVLWERVLILMRRATHETAFLERP